MTSGDVKKVVRFNLNLSPKILSKNTNQIVNTCIGQLYKQMPMTYQIGLQQTKIAAARNKAANDAAIKTLKLKARQDNAKAGFYASEMCYQMKMRKRPITAIPKKALRSQSNEICCPRSYCSSGINSRRWEKSRSTQFYSALAKSNLNESVLQQRYANSVQSIEQAVKVTGQMHQDLIAIDKLLKCLNVTEKEKNANLKDCKNYPASNTKQSTSTVDYSNSNRKSLSDYEFLKRTQLSKPTKKTNISQDPNEENFRPSKVPNHIKRTLMDTIPYRDFQAKETKSTKSSNISNFRERKTNSLVIIENLRAMNPPYSHPVPQPHPHPHRVKRTKQQLSDFQSEFLNIEDKLDNFPAFLKKENTNDHQVPKSSDLGTFFNELDIYKPHKPSKINRNLVCSATYC